MTRVLQVTEMKTLLNVALLCLLLPSFYCSNETVKKEENSSSSVNATDANNGTFEKSKELKTGNQNLANLQNGVGTNTNSTSSNTSPIVEPPKTTTDSNTENQANDTSVKPDTSTDPPNGNGTNSISTSNNTSPKDGPPETLTGSKTENQATNASIKPGIPTDPQNGDSTNPISTSSNTSPKNEPSKTPTDLRIENQVKAGLTEPQSMITKKTPESQDSEQINIAVNETPRSLSATDEDTKKYKLVSEKIDHLPHDNLFVVRDLISTSNDLNISSMGEPIDLVGIKTVNYTCETFEWKNKRYTFRNIVVVNSSLKSNRTFTNTLSCSFSQELEINIDIIPDNLVLQGEYEIADEQDPKIKTNGTFTFNQTGGMLSYTIPYNQGIEIINKNLTPYGDLIYEEGQVKLERACENQCDLFANSASMYSLIKTQIVDKVNQADVQKRLTQFYQAFPLLSTCLSPSKKTNQYFIVKSISSIQNWRSYKLQLGPLIIKGMDNYNWSYVSASKPKDPKEPTNLRVVAKTGLLQGQCDWKYHGSGDEKTAKEYSFTFIIDHIDSNIGLGFKEKFYISDLHIQVGEIVIHRLDKSHPKIHEFTKAILREHINETVATSMRELFSKNFQILENSSGTTKLGNQNDGTTEYPSLVKLSSVSPSTLAVRKVPAICDSNRSWWRKIIFFWRKNKC